jgi:ParB/RepB/Spo0J family partition protein
MKYDDRVISISEIDTIDDTYCLSLDSDHADLVASIEAVGLINPPILSEKKNSKYFIVCGFRRVTACQSLGWKKIRVRVLKGDLSELDLLKLAILDNRSHRPLNVIEQARGIRKLSPHVAAKERLEGLTSLLGFPPNKKVFEKISALDGLPEAIQSGVLDESISFEAAAHLASLSHGDALCLFYLLKGLKLSQNKQIEIITLVREIAMREDLEVEEVVHCEEIRTMMDRPDLNRNERGSMLRAYLKRRRFPTLTKAEADFSDALKALKLNKGMSIMPPPYFEGGPYMLRMTFETVDDFDRCRKILDAMAKNPALQRLWNL